VPDVSTQGLLDVKTDVKMDVKTFSHFLTGDTVSLKHHLKKNNRNLYWDLDKQRIPDLWPDPEFDTLQSFFGAKTMLCAAT
jgi:hypothetical protein